MGVMPPMKSVVRSLGEDSGEVGWLVTLSHLCWEDRSLGKVHEDLCSMLESTCKVGCQGMGHTPPSCNGQTDGLLRPASRTFPPTQKAPAVSKKVDNIPEKQYKGVL